MMQSAISNDFGGVSYTMARINSLIPIYLIWFLSASIAATGVAPPVTNDDPFATCMSSVDLGAMKNTQFLLCYQSELRRQDAKLNAVYAQRKTKLSNPMQSTLIQGQRAWITYRDSWCTLEGMSDQAPSPEINKVDCILSLTKEQIKRIESINTSDEIVNNDPTVLKSSQLPQTQGSNISSKEIVDSVNETELCKNYTEEYTQSMKMDVMTKRIDPNSERAIKFKQQQRLCPQWRANQQFEARKNFKTGLQTLVMNLTECRSQRQQLEATFDQALGYPELDQEIESGMMALGIGQPKAYCDKMTKVVSPYLKLRDLVFKCNTNNSSNISGALNETFGRFASEMRQNGCSI